MKNIKSQISLGIILVIILLFSSLTMGVYLRNTLLGNFNQHFLPSSRFGIPAEIRSHGITELYKNPNDVGWDGQFYYYISNDLFDQKDTAQHLDVAAYRYQRIGLPLLAKGLSLLTLSSWVSPMHYYLTSLLLILLASLVAGKFFIGKGCSPFLILIWSLAMGTQLTLLNGLPDASADALFIIAVVSLFWQRLYIYTFAVTLACLAREGFFIFPACMAAYQVYGFAFQKRMAPFKKRIARVFNLKSVFVTFFPILVFFTWQLWLRLHFGVSASSQASGIIGLPLYNIAHFINLDLSGNNPLVTSSLTSKLEGVGCFLFLVTIFIALYLLIKNTLVRKNIEGEDYLAPVNISLLVISCLYLCFGPTVMMHFSGYMKAGALYFFVIPFLLSSSLQEGRSKFFIWFLVAANCYFYVLFSGARMLPTLSVMHQYGLAGNEEFASFQPECIKKYSSEISQLSVDLVQINTGILTNPLNEIIPRKIYKINVAIKNSSDEPFYSFVGDKGGVSLSYKWLTVPNLEVVKDGVRTPLPETLRPNNEVKSYVFIEEPIKPGKYVLLLTLVQEGCAWFYQKNPKSSLEIPYTIR